MNGGAGGSQRPEERQRFPPPGSSLPISALTQNDLLQALVQGAGQPAEAEISEELRRAREEWRLWKRSSREKARAAAAARGRGLPTLLRGLCGPLRLQPQLRDERELALAVAHCALDDTESVHMRILQTIYKQLTRSSLGCPRYGAHWEELGFQGVDPGTDLRGTGMLGLMQLLYFVTDTRTLPLAREIFQLSQHETQYFPFCIMSFNITRIVTQALREGRLNRVCNRRQQVMAVLNDVYAAAFLQLYHVWKRQHKTVADAGSLLKELELAAKRKPKRLLKSLEAHVNRSAAAPSPPLAGAEMDFVDVCDPRSSWREKPD